MLAFAGMLERQPEVKIIEEPELTEGVKRKLPWFIGVLLYPANLHRLIQIGFFGFCCF
jgi:hypothetical protein